MIKEASQFGLSFASAATSLGFSIAKSSTSFAFGIGRGVSSITASAAGTVFDYIFLGSNNGTGETFGAVVTSAFNIAESLALAPILLGESITSTSLVAASTSLDSLSALFGSDEASFSLASFAQLVRREWQSPVLAESLPAERYSVAAMTRALIAWAAIQAVTHDYQERKWFSAIRELTESEKGDLRPTRGRGNKSRSVEEVHVTEDIVLPHEDGQIVVADIGSPDNSSDHKPPKKLPSRAEILPALRRLSRMALAGYGGAGMIFFGVPLRPPPSLDASITSTASSEERDDLLREQEEGTLNDVISSMSPKIKSSSSASASISRQNGRSKSKIKAEEEPKFSWWNVLLGKHDQEIFESYAFNTKDNNASGLTPPSKATLGSDVRMPRYWVLTDHARKEVVLVLRGTMSFNELAVDLTCDPENFEPACSSDEWPIEGDKPGHLLNNEYPPAPPVVDDTYQVHGGMLKLAKMMGAPGKPVHAEIRNALRRNVDYELVLCGHSLGAGIVGLLSVMWADPKTCLTVRSSGLPADRRVSGFLIAPPCLMSKELSVKCSPMLTSFVHSYDVVSRLSLGSIRDMTRAAMWLCAGKGNETPTSITKRALALQSDYIYYKKQIDTKSEYEWFLSLRKTLEANMTFTMLYPPGRVLWAIEDQELHVSSRLREDSTELRLFEVLEVDKVFDQIIFSRRMLGSHMPHQYDRAIHRLE